MDARVGPVSFPAIQIGLSIFQALEALPFERGLLRVTDAGFDFTFGEKRALQTVAMVERRFSPSRTLFIR